MEPRSRYFHDKQLEGRRLMPQVILRCPMGDRVWGFLNPATNDPIGTAVSTGDMTFDQADFTGQPVLERSDRLVSLAPLNESVQPLEQDVLGSWGQSQRTRLQFEVSNGDRDMTRLVGEEFVLNQGAYLFIGFHGLGWDFSQLRYSGTVNRIVLTKNSLTIEAETLC